MGHFLLSDFSSDGTKVWLQPDAVSNGGSLHDAESIDSHILLGARFNSTKKLFLLYLIDSKDPFFFLVHTEFKSCDLLDQVYRSSGSTNYVNIRPINAWVDYQRKLSYLRDIVVCHMSNKENCANLYFAVIVYVPFFVFERISAALPDIGEMDINKKTSKLANKSHCCSVSEASTIRLPGKSSPVLPAVEISNI